MAAPRPQSHAYNFSQIHKPSSLIQWWLWILLDWRACNLSEIFPHGVGNQVWYSDCLLGHLCKPAFIQFAVNGLKSCTSLSDAVLPHKKMHLYFAIFFFPQAVAALSIESEEAGWRGCYLGQHGAGRAPGIAALLTRWCYRGVDLLVRCSRHVMESGKGKGSTQARGCGGLGYAGLTQAGPALELTGICDGSSTCQLEETGYLEQEFGQWMQEKYFRHWECNVYCDHCSGAAADKSRPVSTQLNNK